MWFLTFSQSPYKRRMDAAVATTGSIIARRGSPCHSAVRQAAIAAQISSGAIIAKPGLLEATIALAMVRQKRKVAKSSAQRPTTSYRADSDSCRAVPFPATRRLRRKIQNTRLKVDDGQCTKGSASYLTKLSSPVR